MVVLFVVSAILIALPYVLYPAVVAVLSRLRRPLVPDLAYRPEVTVVIVCNNEAHRLPAKIETINNLDYPREKIHILVASDGSDDDTAGVARSFGDPRIEVVEFPQRRGKAACINRLLPYMKGEVVFFNDVRQRLEPSALARLAGYFVHPEVGCVSGHLVLSKHSQDRDRTNRVRLYWNIEVMLRTMESRLHNVIGATGAIYAARREALGLIPEDTILDDVVIPMSIVGKGYRVQYDPEAVAFDRLNESSQESRRKLRTLAGNYQMIFRPRSRGQPFGGLTGLMFFGHKISRLLVPWALVLHLVATGMVCPAWGALGWTYAVGQSSMYAAAVACALLRRFDRRVSLLGVPYTFCRLNWVAVAALAAYLRGTVTARWDRNTQSGATPSRRDVA